MSTLSNYIIGGFEGMQVGTAVYDQVVLKQKWFEQGGMWLSARILEKARENPTISEHAYHALKDIIEELTK